MLIENLIDTAEIDAAQKGLFEIYPTPEAFIEEANRLGISKRITGIPKGFKLGEHYVFLAHPKVKRIVSMDPETGADKDEWQAGVFRIFKPTAIEQIVTDVQAKDEEFMADLAKRSITPVIVPADDPDHQGSVYDKEDKDLLEVAA